MKNYNKTRFFTLALFLLLILNASWIEVKGNGSGPPTPAEVFDGHDFTENYWDINVFNNSKWDHPDVNNMTSWLNNTWNIKWIKEGNFEMGMLCFLNKTHWQDGKEVTYTTPAQFWWQHAYKDSKEILIASMQAAWFGFDDNNGNRYYDDGESMNPFFYMGINTDEMISDVGITSNPEAHAIPLQRTQSGSIVTYIWGYNYTNIIFYVPRTNHTTEGFGFEGGFDYSDPGTYINGSNAIGNQTYIAYDYTLTIDTAVGEASLHQDYSCGIIDTLMNRKNDTADWEKTSSGEHGYMPVNWSMCLGAWSFIMTGEDPYALTDAGEGEINATAHKTGLATVETTIGDVHAFDFKFSQKPNYEISNINDTGTFTQYPVVYECLDINNNDEFIEFVAGMPQLIGDFGALLLSYAINQTNQFTYGVPFDDIYENFHPNESAAFFISCYPEYGASGGGILRHDPVFVAYFTPAGAGSEIPGYPLEILMITMFFGIVITVIYKKRLKTRT